MAETFIKENRIEFLIDTHCHLDFDDFAPDLDAVVERALTAGVKRMITISTLIEKVPFLLKLTEQYPEVYCSIGTHPMHAEQELEIKALDILKYLQHQKLVAIGECGLDYYHEGVVPAIQKKVFVEHILAAQQSQYPLIIHARNADEDMADLLQYYSKEKAFPFVLHCYSSGKTLAKTALDLGGYLSFSGIVTFKNAHAIQDIATSIPNDRILIETDAPYLAPVPYRGQRNEPSFVYNTAQYLAQLRAIDLADLIHQTSQNAKKLFFKID